MGYPVFNVGEVLTANDMNAVGLWKVGATTAAASANVDVSSCFSSSYDNYRVLVSLTNSAASNLRMRVLTGTTTPETGLVYDRFGFSWGISATNQVSPNEASLYMGDITNIANTRTVAAFDILNPNLAVETHVLPYSWGSNSGSVFFMVGRIETTTQYTGIRFFADTGNLTGTVRVYGYRN